ncbi:MAG TPA: 3'-5' exonuclease, partial [Vicinamibacterales bacterium]
MTRSNGDAVCEGWDFTPGIVSVWADWSGRATVWRRTPSGLVREDARFRPWALVDELSSALALRATSTTPMSYRELAGEGSLRFLIQADEGRVLRALRERGKEHVLLLPPEEQYLVATGRTYFRDITFDDLRRLQFDLETTGLDAARDRIFLIAVRRSNGHVETLESQSNGNRDEAELIRRLIAVIAEDDPDVIENHNLHGFDLPFLARRARVLG